MQRLIGYLAIATVCFCSNFIALADEETCVACESKVTVTGQFEHRRAYGVTTIRGETWRSGDAFREEIFGTNFAVTVDGLPEGRYTVVIGLVEVDYTNASQRVFDITSGNQVLASNLDLFAAAGGAGAALFISNVLDHAADSISGPLTVNFTGRVGPAKLNLFEVRDAQNQSLVFVRAPDLLPIGDASALTPPVVAGPEIWKDPSQPVDDRVHDPVAGCRSRKKCSKCAIPRRAFRVWVCRPIITGANVFTAWRAPDTPPFFRRPSAWRPLGTPRCSMTKPASLRLKPAPNSTNTPPPTMGTVFNTSAFISGPQRQHLPRPALGPRPGNLRGRPVPDRSPRCFLHPGSPGR